MNTTKIQLETYTKGALVVDAYPVQLDMAGYQINCWVHPSVDCRSNQLTVSLAGRSVAYFVYHYGDFQRCRLSRIRTHAQRAVNEVLARSARARAMILNAVHRADYKDNQHIRDQLNKP